MGGVLAFWQGWRRDQSHYPGYGTFAGLIYCALGLGEAGEVIGEIKKAWRDDVPKPEQSLALRYKAGEVLTPSRRKKILLELGDALWYLDAACDELGSSLDEIALLNIEKIAQRKLEKRNVG